MESSATEWLVLLLVAIFGALIGGLKRYQSARRKGEAMLIGIIEALTVFFIITVSYLVMRGMAPAGLLLLSNYWPALKGAQIPSYGIAGLAGIVGHFGLRQMVRIVMQVIAHR